MGAFLGGPLVPEAVTDSGTRHGNLVRDGIQVCASWHNNGRRTFTPVTDRAEIRQVRDRSEGDRD